MSQRRWCYCADLHLRNWKNYGGEMVAGVNARARRILTVVQDSLAIAVKAGSTDFVILGDIFDQANPSPQLVAALGEVLTASSLNVHLLVGNHDMMSEEAGDHALAPLALMNVAVYDRPTVVGDVLFVPYRKAPVVSWLDAELKIGQKKGATSLAGHFGLINADTPHFLKEAPDAISITGLHGRLAMFGFKSAFVGNWHDFLRKPGPSEMIQCGTICPHQFGEIAGRLVFSPPVSVHAAPMSAPAFQQMKWPTQALVNGTTYLRVTDVSRSVLDTARAQCDEWVLKDMIEGYEIEIEAKGETAVTLSLDALKAQRSKLIIQYIDRTFPGELPAVRQQLRERLKNTYGIA